MQLMDYILPQTKSFGVFKSNLFANSQPFSPFDLLSLNNKFEGFKPGLFDYLKELDKKFGTNKLHQVKKIFRDLRIPDQFHNKFHVDLWMPFTMPNAGGYYDPAENSPFYTQIAINPMVLVGDPYILAHVILHEAIHGGYYQRWSEEKQGYVLGSAEMDETATDDKTMKIMAEVYPGIETRSGYFDLVKEFREVFKNMKEIDEGVLNEAENNSEKLDYYMSRMILGEFEFARGGVKSFAGSIKNLSFQNINWYFKQKWPAILKFFDRTINEIDGNNNLFAEASMYFSRYSLDGVLKMIAQDFVKSLLEKKEFLGFLDEVFLGEKITSVKEAFDLFARKGFAYVLDFGFEDKKEWYRIFEGYLGVRV